MTLGSAVMQPLAAFPKPRWYLRRQALAAALLLGFAAGHARAEEPAAEPAAPTLPGLPAAVDWTFNFDASIGTFGFDNSLYPTRSRSNRLAISATTGSRLRASPRSRGIHDLRLLAALRGPECRGDADLRRSAVAGGRGRFLVRRRGPLRRLAIGRPPRRSRRERSRVHLGRAQYQLGHGLLLWDGAAEGVHAGWLLDQRAQGLRARRDRPVQPGNHTFEAFYLDKDDLPEADSESRLWGANYEYAIGEDTTLGATYMSWAADADEAPSATGSRSTTCASSRRRSRGSRPLSFEAEYAQRRQRRCARLDGLDRLAGYQFSSPWSPGFPTATPSSRVTIPALPRTKPSTRCSPASTTGAPGGRARSRANTSSPTRT